MEIMRVLMCPEIAWYQKSGRLLSENVLDEVNSLKYNASFIEYVMGLIIGLKIIFWYKNLTNG